MLASRSLFTIRMSLHPPHDLGATPLGGRRIIAVSQGEFEGARLRGTVLAHGGSDWLIARADGSFQQDARLTLQTDDGALIGMSYRGIRHSSPEVAARLARGEDVSPADYYLRTAPFFETSAARYAWINHIVSVGVGRREPGGVVYEVFEVL